MRKYLVVLAAVLLPTLIMAQSLDSYVLAEDLGNILASEEFCALEYDQTAITRWIDEYTDPTDMGFAGTLQMMTESTKYRLPEMSESSKTAHYYSIERAARHYRFIE